MFHNVFHYCNLAQTDQQLCYRQGKYLWKTLSTEFQSEYELDLYRLDLRVELPVIMAYTSLYDYLDEQHIDKYEDYDLPPEKNGTGWFYDDWTENGLLNKLIIALPISGFFAALLLYVSLRVCMLACRTKKHPKKRLPIMQEHGTGTQTLADPQKGSPVKEARRKGSPAKADGRKGLPVKADQGDHRKELAIVENKQQPKATPNQPREQMSKPKEIAKPPPPDINKLHMEYRQQMVYAQQMQFQERLKIMMAWNMRMRQATQSQALMRRLASMQVTEEMQQQALAAHQQYQNSQYNEFQVSISYSGIKIGFIIQPLIPFLIPGQLKATNAIKFPKPPI